MLLKDVRSLVYRLHGKWKSQDFKEYPKTRAEFDQVLQCYDPFTLKQSIDYISYEIDMINIKQRQLTEYRTQLKAVQTIIYKNLAQKLAPQQINSTTTRSENTMANQDSGKTVDVNNGIDKTDLRPTVTDPLAGGEKSAILKDPI